MITTGTSPVESSFWFFAFLVVSHEVHGDKPRGEKTINHANHVNKAYGIRGRQNREVMEPPLGLPQWI